VKYVPPFDLIKNSVDITAVKGELRVNLSYQHFINILKLFVSGVEMDEAWYLEQNPDIARAVKEGTISSARQHFIDDGYLEGRLPFQLELDEDWYLTKYPDVAEGMRKGLFESAKVFENGRSEDDFARPSSAKVLLPFVGEERFQLASHFRNSVEEANRYCTLLERKDLVKGLSMACSFRLLQHVVHIPLAEHRGNAWSRATTPVPRRALRRTARPLTSRAGPLAGCSGDRHRHSRRAAVMHPRNRAQPR